VKLPRVVNGQRLITPTDEGKICGFVIAPRETVLYSSDGRLPGKRLDPDLWDLAEYDHRRGYWRIAGDVA
jgi:hypothetical protein